MTVHTFVYNCVHCVRPHVTVAIQIAEAIQCAEFCSWSGCAYMQLSSGSLSSLCINYIVKHLYCKFCDSTTKSNRNKIRQNRQYTAVPMAHHPAIGNNSGLVETQRYLKNGSI